jgi:DNA-binding transcriptional LysR family regulator
MSLDLDALRIFVDVADRGSFTRAAEGLGLSKARVSVRLAALEAELGTRLVQRSTRAVRLTADGEAFLERARGLLDAADELARTFLPAAQVRGRVRADVPQALARNVLIPGLPDLLGLHPGLEVQLSSTDRRVDVVGEGFDCVLRVGRLADSGLVARRLGELPMVNCASHDYLARFGVPRVLADLDAHQVVHYAPRFGADTPSFEYPDAGRYRERPMHARVTVNSTDSYQAACLAGLGIIQVPRLGIASRIEAGELVEILPEFTCEPMPVSILHAHGRAVPRHVRIVMDWIAAALTPHLDVQGARRYSTLSG